MTALDPLVESLYRLIRTGELLPGERVDQRAISERLEVSRTPLREALRALAADGILTRTPNAGYAVAKLSAVDLLQYYSIRAFLEAEVLQTIQWPTDAQMAALRAANEICREAAIEGDVERLIAANRDFHFIKFRLSPLKIMVGEIERVWRVSDPYRALHLSNAERRTRVASDHDEMLQAIERQDVDALIVLMDKHRAASRNLLQEMLGAQVPPSLMILPQSASELHVRAAVSDA
ncbi:GntR family transcriptional regulator [Spirillospora sp. CA-255316]